MKFNSENFRINRRSYLAAATGLSTGLAGYSKVPLRSTATVEGTPRVWHRVTLLNTGPATSESASTNPFLDYRMTSTFTGPSGQTYEVPGHYAADGNAGETSAASGDKWRAHFMPDEAGEWQYQTSFVQGDKVAVNGGGSATAFDGDSGTFTVDSTDKTGRDIRGKGLLKYVDEHYLQFAGTGEHFLKNGAGSPENFLGYYEFDQTESLGGSSPDTSSNLHEYGPHEGDWTSGDPTWQSGKGKGILGAINYLASQRVNSLYLLTYNIDGGDGQDVWPWTDAARDSKRRFDVSKLDQWEVVFEHFTRKGFNVQLVLQETENDTVINNGDLGTERQLYYRELISRFAHHPAITWNLGEETDLSTTQLENHAAYFSDVDPYGHQVVVHTTDGDRDAIYDSLVGNQDFDGPSVQTNNNPETNSFAVKWRQESADAGRPWAVNLDEIGDHRDAVPCDGNSVDGKSQETYRKESLWPGYSGGAAGIAWYFGKDTCQDDRTLEDFRTRDNWWSWTRYAHQLFVNNVAFENGTPDNAALGGGASGYVFDDPGQWYVAYLQDGTDNATLDTTTDNYDLQWYDPQTGQFEGSVTTLSGGSDTDLGTVPSAIGDDAVALLTVTDGGTTNDAPTAVDDDVTVTNGGTVTVDVLANDDDSDGSLDASTVTVVDGPSNGRVSVNSDGTIDYTHDSSDTTSDSFTYTVDDDDGATSNEATVTVSIGSEDQSPYVDHDLSQIQAEDFDTGGEGVAYHDTTSGNNGGAYRDTDVDIQETSDDGGGYNVGWIESGEWWEYTVDVPSDGDYALSARLAGNNSTSMDVTVDGSTVTTVDVPDTGDWQDWQTVDAGTVTLSAGTHVVRVTANGGSFNFNWFGFADGQSGTSQSPYVDHDLSQIQAEDFDTGGEGVAYHDTTSGNNGGAYRDTDVDIQETSDSGGGYNVGWIESGEWWEYTVDVPSDGDYALSARLAGKNATTLDVAVDDSKVATVDVPNTGDWQDWTTVDAGTVSLTAGSHTFRLTANGGSFNVNWFGFDQNQSESSSAYTDHDLSRIEAEDFDTGGEGVAYHDTTSGNNGGAYRDTDVDIQETSDDGGGYNVGWIEAGEWWEYTVDVPADGDYDLTARLAGKNATTLDVAVDDAQVATIDVPDTGDWQSWTTVDAGIVSLTAGSHTFRLTANGGSFNVNWFGFV